MNLGAYSRTMEASLDTPEPAPVMVTKRTRHLRDKARLLVRGNLDGRTKARRQFDAIATGIAADLGGEDRLSTVQKHLVEAFAGAAIHVHDLNARLLLGEQVDIVEHSQAISTMVRVASRIGLNCVAKDVTPSIADIAAEIEAAKCEGNAA
jgi:hypothetical protein